MNGAGSILRERLYNVLAVALAVLLPGILVLLAWRGAADDAVQDARTRFEFRAVAIRDAISGRLLDYEQVLRGTAGLFAASETVERAEWRSYYDSLQLNAYYPGIQGVGYAPRLTARDRDAFVRKVRRDGHAGYDIHPPGDRPLYSPIVYIEPFSGRNLRAFGFDMYSDALRREAMEHATGSARPAVTAKLTLLQETERNAQGGFVMYIPIYRKGMAVDTPLQRRNAIQGHVFGVFRVGNLINRIVGDEHQVAITIHDGTEANEENLLYRAMQVDASPEPPRYVHESRMLIHGRPWTLRMQSTPLFEATVDRDKPLMVLSGGIVIHLLLLAVLWSLWTTRDRALVLARSMTREVRRREAEWQGMNDASPLGVFRSDAGGGFVYVNPRFESIAGIPPQAALGGGWLAAVHAGDRARVQREWEAAVRARDADFSATFRFQHAGGAVVWATVKAALIREDDEVTGYVGSVEDVTERKLATETLMKSRERLSLALEGSNLAMFDWDLASGEVRLSEQWQLILGGGKTETVTTIDELQQLVHADDLPLLRESLMPVIKGNARFYEVQHRVRALNGSWRWILSRAKVTDRSPEGRALRVVGTNADITAGKEVERLKNEFISTVSHELRTPLTAIIGSLGLVREFGGNLDAEVAGFIDMAYQNSERLAALINDVLDLEKIQSGQMTVDLRPLSLRGLLEKAVRINQPYADVHRVRLRLLPGDDFTVSADPDRLMQVLTNLLSNAAKFSPEGAEVEVAAMPHGDRVRVEVRDHGPGIPDNFRASIFQRFERADSSDTRKKGGTGLGLSISKALIEHMNGEIGFESETGRGSTFHFELPLSGKSPGISGAPGE